MLFCTLRFFTILLSIDNSSIISFPAVSLFSVMTHTYSELKIFRLFLHRSAPLPHFSILTFVVPSTTCNVSLRRTRFQRSVCSTVLLYFYIPTTSFRILELAPCSAIKEPLYSNLSFSKSYFLCFMNCIRPIFSSAIRYSLSWFWFSRNRYYHLWTVILPYNIRVSAECFFFAISPSSYHDYPISLLQFRVLVHFAQRTRLSAFLL